jgi:hypothetical protein
MTSRIQDACESKHKKIGEWLPDEELKVNFLLSFVSKWIELENIILSEVSLAQKTKNHMFSLICGH